MKPPLQPVKTKHGKGSSDEQVILKFTFYLFSLVPGRVLLILNQPMKKTRHLRYRLRPIFRRTALLRQVPTQLLHLKAVDLPQTQLQFQLWTSPREQFLRSHSTNKDYKRRCQSIQNRLIPSYNFNDSSTTTTGHCSILSTVTISSFDFRHSVRPAVIVTTFSDPIVININMYFFVFL